ncbi:MAG: RagB/SusD family nutrient uptake outer membrane protein, partial [Muribaculaceae bacterium]|nr:RagB/SusD family nutrient uptake outer membrane protein [Muribaculaceae bacterium]
LFKSVSWASEMSIRDSCITYSNKIIGSGKYSLEPDFSKLFNADNHLRTNEIIYGIEIDGENTMTWGATTNLVHGSCGSDNSQDPTKYGIMSGWGNYRVRGEYADLFGAFTSSTDSRCLLWTDGQLQYFDTALDDGTCGYHSEKWTNLTDTGEMSGNPASDGVDTDFPMFRLAEIYLNAAEAVLRGGSGMSRTDALNLVNAVRQRAYGDDSGNIADTQLNLDFLLDERGREMLYENVRRTDLIRHGKFTTSSYIWQWKGGVAAGRAVADRYNRYPIPASEISANSNLSNPEY